MNYIIYEDKKFMHFFHTPFEGLCLKCKQNGRWGEVQNLCSEARDGFGVFSDSDGVIHILCSDKNNNIIYVARKNDDWNKYVLSEGTPEIEPLEFRICKAGNILNFFYTAEYKDSVILVHCVLGANAKPEIIDTLYSEHPQFSLNSGKVYYTNKNMVLGYRDFSDSKPDTFCEVEKDAIFAYAAQIDEKEFLVYKKDDFLYVNGDRTFLDAHSASPVIGAKDNRLTLQWRSGNFVRYLTSFNNGTTWSAPMRFIGNGEKICRFAIQIGEETNEFYGQCLNPEPVIYGKSNLFFAEVPKIISQKKEFAKDFTPTEYKKLQILIDMQKNEIKTLKAKIKKLENSGNI